MTERGAKMMTNIGGTELLVITCSIPQGERKICSRSPEAGTYRRG